MTTPFQVEISAWEEAEQMEELGEKKAPMEKNGLGGGEGFGDFRRECRSPFSSLGASTSSSSSSSAKEFGASEDNDRAGKWRGKKRAFFSGWSEMKLPEMASSKQKRQRLKSHSGERSPEEAKGRERLPRRQENED